MMSRDKARLACQLPHSGSTSHGRLRSKPPCRCRAHAWGRKAVPGPFNWAGAGAGVVKAYRWMCLVRPAAVEPAAAEPAAAERALEPAVPCLQPRQQIASRPEPSVCQLHPAAPWQLLPEALTLGSRS